MFGTFLAWLLGAAHQNNPPTPEVEALRAENARLHADLAAMNAENADLRTSYEFYYNAFKEGNRARRPDGTL